MISKDIFSSDEDDFEFATADYEDYETMMFNPVGVNIDDTTVVDIIHNAQIIKTDRWDNVIMWINDNWNDLNGQYQISHQGAVLYTVVVSR